MYNYTSDKQERLGFLDKNEILQYVSEEEIFELVFGFIPKEFQYITSPLRKDKKPGCWFEKGLDGRLVFRDFNYGSKPIDCFQAVMDYYKIPNFYQTLKFIKRKLIDDKGKKIVREIPKQEPIVKKPVEIFVETRDFLRKDGIYWSKYGITKENLIKDKVFPVRKFSLKNSRNGDVTNRVYESCYAFTEFKEGRKKLYFPFRKGSHRFITNCKKNDIGNIDNVYHIGRTIIISKSYKDCRVLTNNGNHCIWIQNEGMLPDYDYIIPTIKGYENIIVWFDNDQAGIKASIKMKEYLSKEIGNKVSSLWLPEHLNEKGISDPSDLYKKDSKQSLISFIYEKIKV